MAYWLMKSEPETYGWDDLVADGATDWDGVRNNAARLHLRAMEAGDEAFFYHSGDVRAVVGIMAIAGAGSSLLAAGDHHPWRFGSPRPRIGPSRRPDVSGRILSRSLAPSISATKPSSAAVTDHWGAR